MATDNNNDPSGHSSRGKAALIILGAVVLLFVLSLLPWHNITGGRMTDFNLLGDIMPLSQSADSILTQNEDEDIDPELMHQLKENGEVPQTAESDTVLPQMEPLRVGEMVVIEDYTRGKRGMQALREAIVQGRLARIAFLGDSYIEGDILCQDFRSMMQQRYGGSGVGYLNLHSEFPGFRRSVRQGGDGWKEYSVRSGAKPQYVSLTENYFSPEGNAKATYKGVNKIERADSWQHSQLLCVAPSGGEVKMRLSDTARWEVMTLSPSPDVQRLELKGTTSQFQVSSSTSSLIALGVWLDSDSGVSVDCMSSRGYSGLTLAKVDSALCAQASQYIDYQLIILEFGINAMSAKQKNYTVYANGMVKVINHLRECYPKADILLMGIGDRGEKSGTEVHSMPSAQNMIDAQRDVARKARCMFWDTREAMGGEDAIVRYVSSGWANKDYVHLTHRGGRTLAEQLFNAFTAKLDQ